MTRISFVNNKFIDHNKAFIHIEDRGFQFADGIYEIILFSNRNLIDKKQHFHRLFRSLKELEITFELAEEYLTKIILELFKQNNIDNGSVYLQITRGVAKRNQTFSKNISPSLIITVSPLAITRELKPLSVISHNDIRWGRCDIKSIALIAGVLAKQKSLDLGKDDAILLKNGLVTEGSFSNVFIVDQKNNLITREVSNDILQGITRDRIISLAKKNNINVIEKPFSITDAFGAKELFMTSSTLLLRPVIQLDNKKIADGKIGEISQKLANLYLDFIGVR